MEQTNILQISSKKIDDNIISTKIVIEKQINLFEKLLVRNISSQFENIDIERLNALVLQYFSEPAKAKIEEVFNKLQEDELSFYNKHLKTSDLIFKSVKEKRTKTIYLDNVIKKINLKDNELENVFACITKNNHDSNEIGVDGIFKQFIDKVFLFSRLSIDEKDELYELSVRYYDILKQDMYSTLEKLFIANQKGTIKEIEDEMDKQEVRGKTTAISKFERKLTTQAILAMEKLLNDSIVKNKKIAIEDLRVCSASVVDLIFKTLPEEFQDQRELLEVIVDTNINERLSKLLEDEIGKLKNNISAINNNKIENELYEEKRYKNIDEYECEFDLVNKVYQDVLHEVRIAYDIPEDDTKSKKIDMIILSETNSTKMVFQKLINMINYENKNNLKEVTEKMYESRDKYCNTNTDLENQEPEYQNKI